MKKILICLQNIEGLLLAQKPILNVKELSIYTGFTESFIYKLTSSNRIPFSKPFGKKLVFDRMRIDELLLKNTINPIDDIEQESINYRTGVVGKGGRI